VLMRISCAATHVERFLYRLQSPSPNAVILILVTGAGGFIGTALCEVLSRKGVCVRGTIRSSKQSVESDTLQHLEIVPSNSIDGNVAQKQVLEGVRTVVHLAARTHVLHESEDALSQYRESNVDETARIAESAAGMGVRRFIFMSTVKVNGERTFDRPFLETDPARPEDAYAISKWEAECLLARIAQRTGMEVVVLRAPLVYGPRVRANFLRLMQWVACGTPLPFSAVHNRRSLIYVGNLVDAIVACVEAPESAHKTYLVSDGEDISTPGLIRALAAALKVPARLFSLPAPALKLAGALLGKKDEIARLTGSLQVDSSRIRSELDWRPPFRLSEGLAATARWYRSLG
jgi:nucleoside-diphosphate-sugar epimerase